MTIWSQKAQKLSNEQIAILHRAEAERQRHQVLPLAREPIREAMQELAEDSDRAKEEIKEVYDRIGDLKRQLANEEALLRELQAVQAVRGEALSRLEAVEPNGQAERAVVDGFLTFEFDPEAPDVPEEIKKELRDGSEVQS